MSRKNLPLYRLVDEELIASFSDVQREYMKDYYYSIYVDYCKYRHKRTLNRDVFFTNMRRKKVKLIQICCPYCGRITCIPIEGTLEKTIGIFNYCFNCGKPSITVRVAKRFDRLIRMAIIHRLGKAALAEIKKDDDTDLELFTHDVMQFELVEIESTMESLLREMYRTLLYIKFRNVKESFLSSLIQKDEANDFLNIDKANNHFKKALEINLKTALDPAVWNDLIDLNALRSAIIHNDGKADEKFKNSTTFKSGRVQHMMRGDLIVVSESDVQKYMDAVKKLFDFLDKKLDEEFCKNAPIMIANSVFNRITETTNTK